MKVFILTLGCPKNIVDSERLASALREHGHEIAGFAGDADLVLVNTCAFLREAEREARSVIARMARAKPVGVIGCLPARRKQTRRIRGQAPAGTTEIIALADRIFRDPDYPGRLLDSRPYAYLKIAEGCSRRCSFCVIPAIRGPLRSRAIGSILVEARALLDSGKKELVLVAQDTSQFGQDTGESLTDLLVALDRLKRDFWLRLMYLHPGGVDRKLAQALGSLDHLVPYLHVPVQHFSDRLLRAMGRERGRADVERALEAVRSALPRAFIRTDVMVGFPGECEEDFDLLLQEIGEGTFHRVAVFLYSAEEGSPGFNMQQPDTDVISERFAMALSAADALHMRVQAGLVGKQLRVMVDGPGTGRTAYDAPEVDFNVILPAGIQPGGFVDVVPRAINEEGDLLAG